MEILLSIYVFVFGMLLGSFLGLVAERLPAGESVVRPRSHCRSCSRQLAWYENIPILSYLFLRGQCRSCGAKIPIHHFLIEIATAVLALYAFHHLHPWPRFLLYLLLFLAPVLLLITMDFRYLVLPDVITLPAIPVAVLLHILDARYLAPVKSNNLWAPLGESLLGVAVGAGTLLLLALVYHWLRKREGLGGGDVKFAAMLGAIFGWKAIFFIFLLSSLLGLLLGLFLIFFRGQSKELQLPFGSALGVVSIVFLFHGDRLVHFYIKLFNI